MEKLNELINCISSFYPLDFSQTKEGMSQDERIELANLHVMKGFQQYLNKAINKNILAVAMAGASQEEAIAAKARIVTLIELRVLARKCFEDIQSIKKRSLQDEIKDNATQIG